jgi:hypothetical protein
VKKLLLSAFLLLSANLFAQFSAYDSFDDNVSGWNERKDDSAVIKVQNGKLDVQINYGVDLIDAKGATLDSAGEFRAEINVQCLSSDPKTPFGLCFGASDMDNYFLFYITKECKYGFKALIHNEWLEIVPPTSSPFIDSTGVNWLRVNIVKENSVLKTHLVINEFLVRSLDHIQPYGNFYGIYVGGKQHILFDDFHVYQRGKTQEEPESADLSLSLKCSNGQLYYANPYDHWGTCVNKGVRVDEDSTVVRFWYSDKRFADYTIVCVPMTSLGSVSFEKAAVQDFGDYMAMDGDDIKPGKKEGIQKVNMGADLKVYQVGETYSAPGQPDLYIRRYYVDRVFGDNVGMVFQFIVPVDYKNTAAMDTFVKSIILSFDAQ